ncbi:MAG: hypothetical protein Q4C50_04900 [Eubacteriales bacterium]|nr:hypothetical protein [Eubacteriales bacterium]
MTITRIKKAAHPCGEIAMLIFVNTGISSSADIQTVAKSLATVVSTHGLTFLPDNITARDALCAHRVCNLIDRAPGAFDRNVEAAHEWLTSHSSESVIVDIDDIFMTAQTWFVSFWCIIPELIKPAN